VKTGRPVKGIERRFHRLAARVKKPVAVGFLRSSRKATGMVNNTADRFTTLDFHARGLLINYAKWRLMLRSSQPEPEVFWDELEIRLLRSEAEAVVLYDPIFPSNPFAH
jgi:hypothetical protein